MKIRPTTMATIKAIKPIMDIFFTNCQSRKPMWPDAITHVKRIVVTVLPIEDAQ